MFAYGSDGAAVARLGGTRGGPRELAVPAGPPPRRAAPRPPRAVANEAGPDRVVEDVLDRRLVVLFAVDDSGGEALREQGAASSVAGVVFPGVVALVPLGRLREILRAAVDDRVVVGSHQAVDVQAELEADESAAEEPQEQEPVQRVQEERSLVDAVRRDVEVAVRQVRAEDASHGTDSTAPPTSRQAAGAVPLQFRHDFARRVGCQTLAVARRATAYPARRSTRR